jgi:hypothetical protein
MVCCNICCSNFIYDFIAAIVGPMLYDMLLGGGGCDLF